MWGFGHMKNKHTLYRRKDFMKNVCKSLREHAQIIIGFEKEKFHKKTLSRYKLSKVRDHCHHTGKIQRTGTQYLQFKI